MFQVSHAAFTCRRIRIWSQWRNLNRKCLTNHHGRTEACLFGSLKAKTYQGLIPNLILTRTYYLFSGPSFCSIFKYWKTVWATWKQNIWLCFCIKLYLHFLNSILIIYLIEMFITLISQCNGNAEHWVSRILLKSCLTISTK